MSTSEPNFDWSQAASLLGDDPSQVDSEMSAIVVELTQSADASIEELRKMDPENDRKGISSAAHQLRGSLLNFGFTEVGGILLKIEKSEYVSGDYPKIVDQVKATFDASKKLLTARYPSIKLA